MTKPLVGRDVGRLERQRRRPVLLEARQIRRAALNVLAGMSLLVPAAMVVLYQISHPPPDTLDLVSLVGWAREQRGGWNDAILLGVPVSVLVPSVLTVLLASSPAWTGTATNRSAREVAYLEHLKALMFGGLLVSIFLALLAAIPRPGDVDLPGEVLALAIAAGCALLTPTLRVDGFRRDLLVVQARARRDAAFASRRRLRAQFGDGPAWLQHLLTSGPLAGMRLMAVGVALLGFLPGLAIWVAVGVISGPTPVLPKVGVSFLLMAYFGSQALFLLVAASRRRLATRSGGGAGFWGMLAVPSGALGVSVLVAVISMRTDGTSMTAILWWFVGCHLCADLIAFALNRTILASVFDYRWLTSLASSAVSQMRYLGGDEVMAVASRGIT